MDLLIIRIFRGAWVGFVVACCCVGGAAQAGVLHLTGKTSRITVSTPAGVKPVGVAVNDGGLNDEDTAKGKIQVTLGTNEQEKKFGTITILLDGEPIFIKVDTSKPDKNGVFHTYASLEPLSVPTFAGVNVWAVIDLVGLLDEGTTFGMGQMLDVVNGLVSESLFVTFKDTTGVPAGAEFDELLLDSLPKFTGSVTVATFASLTPAPLPEPSTLALLVLCLFGVFARKSTLVSAFSQSHGEGVTH